MAIELLVGDQRTNTFKSWSTWMNQISRLRQDWVNEIWDDPLCYNETASVSFLVAAATRNKWLALAEYTMVKKSKNDRRRNANGRADLYVYDTGLGVSWSIEAKQSQLGSGRATLGQAKKINEAISDAQNVNRAEADHRFGLVVTLHEPEDEPLDWAAAVCCQDSELRVPKPNYLWRITNRGHEHDWVRDAYLAFYQVS